MARDFWPDNAAAHFLNAFLLSLALCLVMGQLATRFGFVDIPTLRKRHESPVPLVGFALFLAFAGSLLLLDRIPADFSGLWAGMAAIALVGLADDKFDLRAPMKLAAQLLCVAGVVYLSDIRITDVGNIDHGRTLMLGTWSIPFTIFAMVGMINAVNMIDGLDGLAGGVSLGSLACFAIAALSLDRTGDLFFILLLGGSVLGFLILNLRHPWRRRACVFLGDSGSMMLGLALAFVAIRLSQMNDASISPVAALWICGLPVIDTLSLIVRRLALGQNPMLSDRRHLHYLLLEAGLSVSQTVGLLVSINLAMGAIGLFGWYEGVSDQAMLAGLAIPLWIHTTFVFFNRPRIEPWKRTSH